MAAPVTLAVIDHRLTVAQQALAMRIRQGNLDAAESLQAYIDATLEKRFELTHAS